MNIQAFPSGPFDTNCYVVSCPRTSKAAVVDPAPYSAPSVITFLQNEKLDLDKILLTHSHWDHIADTSKILEYKQVPVYIHSLDTPNLITPGSDLLPFWVPIKGVKDFIAIDAGDLIQLGSLQFEVIHTPGHTLGSVCFYSKNPSILFSGDTLFKGSIGNLSFPTSKPELMNASLQKIAKLPLETMIYSGHGSSTTLEQESWLSRAKEIFNL